jgi:hypothetical protein
MFTIKKYFSLEGRILHFYGELFLSNKKTLSAEFLLKGNGGTILG